MLQQIGAQEIARVLVFNKSDLLSDVELQAMKARFPEAVFVSSLEGSNIDDLIRRIALVASAQEELIDVLVPYDRGDLVSLAHKSCTILSESYGETGTKLSLRVKPELKSRFEEFITAGE